MNAGQLTIGDRTLARGQPSFIVAEVAQAHDGSLGTAHAFIDAVATTGADAIKFQTHIAAAESTPAEPWRVRFSPQDASRYDYWKRMEFDEEQWRGLRQHAIERGLMFLSSPFSLEAAELLHRVGMPGWKIASGEVSNAPLLEFVAATARPVLLSSGMSTLAELDDAVTRLRSRGAPLAVLQCTSLYPTPPEQVGVRMLPVLRERYGCCVGLSDHSGTIYPALAAATIGAEILEVHVTLSRAMFGPDVAASVTIDELRTLVRGVRFIEDMNSAEPDKDLAAAELAPLRRLFTKSVVCRHDLPAGAVLREEDLVGRKPGTGIPIGRLPEVVGRRLKSAVRANELLVDEHLERC